MVVPIVQAVRVESRTEVLQTIRAFIQQTVAAAELDERIGHHIVLAVDEAITSIIGHAHANGKVGRIELEISIDRKQIRITIVESGNDLDLDEMSPHELKDWIERARSLELGVFLIRQIMDGVDYTYRKGTENRLELIKLLA